MRESDIVKRYLARDATTHAPIETVAQIALAEDCSREAIYIILRRAGHTIKTKPRAVPGPQAPRVRTLGKRAYGGRQRRFVAAKVHGEEVWELPDNHPAMLESRALFTRSVRRPKDVKRMLIGGVNSPKTGRIVTKGPWKGFPIFTLTLEERKTCPRSCAIWAGCYGNSSPFSRRHDVFNADFMPMLEAEVIRMGATHPRGFVVRLHILGDFFSVEYVRLWASLLDRVPALHVFGYTARQQDQDDGDSQAIAREIAALTSARWDRFAIRTSHAHFGPEHSVVVAVDPGLPDVIVCPAQTGATECCGTCGICWAPAARGKTIAFIKHGPVGRRGKRA